MRGVGGRRRRTIPPVAAYVARPESRTLMAVRAVDFADYDGASPLGGWNGSAYTGITGLVVSGSNFSAWNGSGIVTTMPQATTGITTLATAEMSNVWGIS